MNVFLILLIFIAGITTYNKFLAEIDRFRKVIKYLLRNKIIKILASLAQLDRATAF